MNPQLLAEINRRNIPRLHVACATAALLLIAAAVLLATFEVAVWEMKLLARSLAPGKAPAPVRRPNRYARYDTHSYRWRT
jgi:hypothetical protein